MLKKLCIVFALAAINTHACLAHIYLEKEYQNHWCKCNNGQTEYRLSDLTRIDCLTKDYAIEFDFANKWAESIGQSLYYALMTGKKAGVVLIIENGAKDTKYLNRLKCVAQKYNIKVWAITPEQLSNSKY